MRQLTPNLARRNQFRAYFGGAFYPSPADLPRPPPLTGPQKDNELESDGKQEKLIRRASSIARDISYRQEPKALPCDGASRRCEGQARSQIGFGTQQDVHLIAKIAVDQLPKKL